MKEIQTRDNPFCEISPAKVLGGYHTTRALSGKEGECQAETSSGSPYSFSCFNKGFDFHRFPHILIITASSEIVMEGLIDIATSDTLTSILKVSQRSNSHGCITETPPEKIVNKHYHSVWRTTSIYGIDYVDYR